MPHLPKPVHELSLRHLPDVSDASFSFQIPVSDKDDYLLADGDADFFQGADDSIATTAAPRATRDPLTLSQLTPRPHFENAAPRLQVPHSQPHPSNPLQRKLHDAQGGEEPKSSRTLPKTTSTPKLNVITQAIQVPSEEGSSIVERLETLRAEAEMLTSVPPARTITLQERKPSTGSSVQREIRRQSHEKRRLAEKRQEIGLAKPKRKSTSISSAACSLSQTVVEGGITKVRSAGRNKPSSTNPAVAPLPPKAPPSEAVHHRLLAPEHTIEMDSNISLGSVPDEVAARLVQYSEKLIGSFGLFNSDRLSGPIDVPEISRSYFGESSMEELSRSGQHHHDERDTPLTLSQLSPRKLPPCTRASTSPEPAPEAPIRFSIKRPASVVPESSHVQKKGKIASSKGADASTSRRQTPSASESRPLSKRHRAATDDARLASNTMSRGKASARVSKVGKQVPLGGSEDSKHRAASTAAASTSSSMSSSLQVSHMKCSGVGSTHADTQDRRPGTSNSIASLSRSAKPVVIAPAIPTRPIAFNFHLGGRMESRKGRDADADKGKGKATLQKKRSASALSIPDFKALHATQEAELAARKENIHLVIPHPIAFKTDQRVKERQKFDERMREKERELEKAMEERRREREEAEEREIKELRKRAVPKAHEVPEWYKEAPKRKDKVVDSIDRC